ncbi:hypothetical protein NKJ93_02155 [Mesorhizobium sp. M0028]|uniref:hypothetical protein n=1 Tax=Mesorhizobium sp. M0028 TaxID=2956849 RepID=UPI0033385522
MDAQQFHEMFSILHNIDLFALEQAGVITPGAKGGSDWRRFNNDLTTFVLKLPDDRRRKLWALVEQRQGKAA